MIKRNEIKEFMVNGKLIIITHSDLDGSVCGLMLKYLYKEVYLPDDIISYKCSYSNIDSLSNEIYDGVPDGSVIIYSDICPGKETLDKFIDRFDDDVVVLDHHESAMANIPAGFPNIIVTSDSSACNTVIRFARREYKMSGHVLSFTSEASEDMIGKFATLAAIADDYDSWTLSDNRSISMNDLYFSDKESFEYNMMSGFCGFSKQQEDTIIGINRRKDMYYKTLKIHQICDGATKIVLCDVDNYISEIANRILIDTEADVVLARGRRSVSVRSTSRSPYSAKTLAEAAGGGGHDCSAGFAYSNRRDLEGKIGNILETVGE